MRSQWDLRIQMDTIDSFIVLDVGFPDFLLDVSRQGSFHCLQSKEFTDEISDICEGADKQLAGNSAKHFQLLVAVVYCAQRHALLWIVWFILYFFGGLAVQQIVMPRQ